MNQLDYTARQGVCSCCNTPHGERGRQLTADERDAPIVRATQTRHVLRRVPMAMSFCWRIIMRIKAPKRSPLRAAYLLFALLAFVNITSCIGSNQTQTVIINSGPNPIMIESSDAEKLGTIQPGEMLQFGRFYPTRQGGEFYFVITEILPADNRISSKWFISSEEFDSNFVDNVLILSITASNSEQRTLIRTLD